MTPENPEIDAAATEWSTGPTPLDISAFGPEARLETRWVAGTREWRITGSTEDRLREAADEARAAAEAAPGPLAAAPHRAMARAADGVADQAHARAERERREAEDVPEAAPPQKNPGAEPPNRVAFSVPGVIELADTLHEHWKAVQRLLTYWEEYDLPEPLAARLAEKGVSPTGVAESLATATRNVTLVAEALSDD